jgi:hypothetical protein
VRSHHPPPPDQCSLASCPHDTQKALELSRRQRSPFRCHMSYLTHPDVSYFWSRKYIFLLFRFVSLKNNLYTVHTFMLYLYLCPYIYKYGIYNCKHTRKVLRCRKCFMKLLFSYELNLDLSIKFGYGADPKRLKQITTKFCFHFQNLCCSLVFLSCQQNTKKSFLRAKFFLSQYR